MPSIQNGTREGAWTQQQSQPTLHQVANIKALLVKAKKATQARCDVSKLMDPYEDENVEIKYPCGHFQYL